LSSFIILLARKKNKKNFCRSASDDDEKSALFIASFVLFGCFCVSNFVSSAKDLINISRKNCSRGRKTRYKSHKQKEDEECRETARAHTHINKEREIERYEAIDARAQIFFWKRRGKRKEE